MKNLLLSCVFLFTSFFSFCQRVTNPAQVPHLPLTGSQIVYTSLVTLDPPVSKEKLFDNAQEWYRHNFESADNTFIINNIETGVVKGTGIIHARKREKETNPADLFFNIAIAVDKGRYQYTADSIYSLEDTTKVYYSDMYSEELYPRAKTRWPKAYRETMLINMNDRISAMLTKMQDYMKSR